MSADVTLVGNATSDGELSFTASGTARFVFSVADNKKYEKNGQTVEEVSFFDVTVWAGLAEAAAVVVRKGARVIVKGALEQRSWETADGDKRSKVEIKAYDVAISAYAMDDWTKKERDSQSQSSARPAATASAPTPADVKPW